MFHSALAVSIFTRYNLLSSDAGACQAQGIMMQFGAMGLVVWYVSIGAGPRSPTATKCGVLVLLCSVYVDRVVAMWATMGQRVRVPPPRCVERAGGSSWR